MKISYNWLQEYFDKPLPNPKDLADLLNIRAFEVEEIEEHDGDSVLEIKITPDRAPDCLSHLGVAREVAIHTGFSIVDNMDIVPFKSDFETEYSVVAEENSIQRYILCEVKNVVVKESPLELKLKLEAIGQRSINTIVDITNIVMYEIGQPMHAFDADKISGKTITIGVPKNPKITTLDGKEVELSDEDLTIQDESDNLAIAGVKGGNKSEVNSATVNILLESANFFPVKVRKTSKRTGIQTDSSKRFENGLTPKLAEKAMHFARYYIKKYASNENTEFSMIKDAYPRPQPRPYSVGLKIENVSKKIGIHIPDEDILNVLNMVGITYKKTAVKKTVIALANEAIGKPYAWGASVLFDAPNSFDCASLVAYVYSRSGVQVPRISVDQCLFSSEIKREQLEPGDLVFSNTGLTLHIAPHLESKEFLPGTKIDSGIDHVGIYIGDNKVLHAGSNLGKVEVEDMDESAYFKNKVKYGRLAEKDEERYVLEIPYERLDLKIEEDIIEEIGRVYGYEHVTPVAPMLNSQAAELSIYDKITTIKSHLTDICFDEVVTYSFQKKGDVAVAKPLAKDKGFLRPDLTKGLTDALDLNFRNKELFAEEVIRIFEVGHVFVGNAEKVVLGIAVRSASKKQKSKAILEETLAYLSEKIGVQISVQIADGQEVVEIDLAGVLGSITNVHNTLSVLPATQYKPFSPYPFMTRDVAVWASSAKTKNDIEKIITDNAGDLLVRYDLFDEFSKDEKMSFAYRLVFQSHERTLTDEEVNPIMDKIYATLQADSDFEIR